MRAVISAIRAGVILALLTTGGALGAQETVPETPPEAVEEPVPQEVAPPTRGPITNLPLPRFVSIKASEANVRRGPSLTHRIDWVFKRRNLPVEITAEYGHWRRVRDRDGAGGWVHYSLLSGVRYVIVDADPLDVRVNPDEEAAVAAQFEAGVIAELGRCDIDWCRIGAGGYRGWALKTGLWGVDAEEVRE
ncbi:SH3-like domain-containing protein [Poseidonocella pacifica]|uniref:SH3-like domain-containing protein n=1 Tax=Poseidonocella pacifica TaxID=871651 RepID=A0A1I0YGW6_9RHOB|nr:SH3 domain-containing protein [Poseidonocella pacifica]SFB12685.1 SH3-like domain-containing protein [Poseidonocella pacifica]